MKISAIVNPQSNNCEVNQASASDSNGNDRLFALLTFLTSTVFLFIDLSPKVADATRPLLHRFVLCVSVALHKPNSGRSSDDKIGKTPFADAYRMHGIPSRRAPASIAWDRAQKGATRTVEVAEGSFQSLGRLLEKLGKAAAIQNEIETLVGTRNSAAVTSEGASSGRLVKARLAIRVSGETWRIVTILTITSDGARRSGTGPLNL